MSRPPVSPLMFVVRQDSDGYSPERLPHRSAAIRRSRVSEINLDDVPGTPSQNNRIKQVVSAAAAEHRRKMSKEQDSANGSPRKATLQSRKCLLHLDIDSSQNYRGRTQSYGGLYATHWAGKQPHERTSQSVSCSCGENSDSAPSNRSHSFHATSQSSITGERSDWEHYIHQPSSPSTPSGGTLYNEVLPLSLTPTSDSRPATTESLAHSGRSNPQSLVFETLEALPSPSRWAIYRRDWIDDHLNPERMSLSQNSHASSTVPDNSETDHFTRTQHLNRLAAHTNAKVTRPPPPKSRASTSEAQPFSEPALTPRHQQRRLFSSISARSPSQSIFPDYQTLPGESSLSRCSTPQIAPDQFVASDRASSTPYYPFELAPVRYHPASIGHDYDYNHSSPTYEAPVSPLTPTASTFVYADNRNGNENEHEHEHEHGYEYENGSNYLSPWTTRWPSLAAASASVSTISGWQGRGSNISLPLTTNSRAGSLAGKAPSLEGTGTTADVWMGLGFGMPTLESGIRLASLESLAEGQRLLLQRRSKGGRGMRSV